MVGVDDELSRLDVCNEFVGRRRKTHHCQHEQVLYPLTAEVNSDLATQRQKCLCNFHSQNCFVFLEGVEKYGHSLVDVVGQHS